MAWASGQPRDWSTSLYVFGQILGIIHVFDRTCSANVNLIAITLDDYDFCADCDKIVTRLDWKLLPACRRSVFTGEDLASILDKAVNVTARTMAKGGN
jgi:hypothetical protein